MNNIFLEATLMEAVTVETSVTKATAAMEALIAKAPTATMEASIVEAAATMEPPIVKPTAAMEAFFTETTTAVKAPTAIESAPAIESATAAKPAMFTKFGVLDCAESAMMLRCSR